MCFWVSRAIQLFFKLNLWSLIENEKNAVVLAEDRNDILSLL